MRTNILSLFALASLATACAASSADEATSGDQAISGGKVTMSLTANHEESISGGSASVGTPIEIDYDISRLATCRDNANGGGPGWDITGFWSQNGAAAKSFSVTKLSADGKSRVATPASITPTQGGDIAVWFEITSIFGCNDYDSDFGANFHISVAGSAPSAVPVITFDASGAPTLSGTLHAGGKVAVHYDPARLSQCESSQGGFPQYSVSGDYSINGGAAQSFATGHAENGALVASDATIDLPASGDLALWFETNGTSGCHGFDSSNGANYHFPIN